MITSELTMVTPTLNSAKTIRGTLESLRPLVEGGAEHIVVDSGSDDGTVEIARQFGSEVLYHPPGNMYAAINAGMARAKGKWLTYINGDDLLFADSTREALEGVSEAATVIYGDIDFIDEQGRFLFSRRAPNPCHLSWLMRYYNPFPQQGTLFRREVFERMDGFRPNFRFAADLDFFVRCRLQGERFSKFRGKSVAAFRLSPNQLSQSARVQMAPEGIRIRAELPKERRSIPVWLGRPAANLYRWSTNMDGMLLRWLRGRKQDAGWRS
jgi:glycosyltransferase involved in cell wall biosynthesis